MSYTFTSAIKKEGNYYVARCVELGVVSQGKTLDEATNHLQEAVSLYLENNTLTKSFRKSRVFVSSFEVTI